MYNAKHPPEEEWASPIHQNTDGKWYFWDESWSHESAPYNTQEACQNALDKYTAYLNGDNQERNRIAVMNFFAAFNMLHGDIFVQFGDELTDMQIVNWLSVPQPFIPLPATWQNQAKQAVILLGCQE